ncbi:hypothetical protein BBJ29_004227 [Phytophthora kernoviae]|uniref:Uncharacterized protein n=1 Tax=Phytophthora kernoviae TaxID=325452 RepID=A0A3F2RRA9_9STRA|nr:hypothetical protein BBP00_00005131 [Phytophthora kernoviae]RLN64311.1 hypothetical protein BBJ29_004227 [Phytophthora kernoviae]
MADPNAKLNSLFGKKKKKKSTTVNANVIVKTSAQNAEKAAAAAAAAAVAPPTKPAAKNPAAPTASGKVLSDLSLSKEEEEKASFQWAKQPKKYKNADDKEAVATTWEEQQERNRVNRRIQLDSERAFPTLGVDSAKTQLQGKKAPTNKAVETKNAWATLHDQDEDSD